MSDRELSTILGRVRELFAASGADDGALLERLKIAETGAEAEAAFELLLARHGAMVLGVCRRILRDPDDVADAFQATFLVLLRRADSVRVEDSLGPWLYGVVRKVATRAKRQGDRRRRREGNRLSVEPASTRPPDADERPELFQALREEVERLSEPFRSVVILCDLEGLKHETAAIRLGCPVGTVESRLSRGRGRLRAGLARRGLAPSALSMAGLSRELLPETLRRSTIAAATGSTAVSPSVASLIQSTLTETFSMKVGLSSAVFAGVAILCGSILARNPDQAPGPVAAPTSSKPEAEARLAPPAKAKPGDRFVIEVLQALPGRPISGERRVRPDGTISLGFYGDLKVAGLTRTEIKVELIGHLRKYLSDDILGLSRFNPQTNTNAAFPADRSDAVFVDEVFADEPRPEAGSRELSEKLDLVLKAIEKDRKPAAGPAESTVKLAPPAKAKPGDHLRVEALEALPGRPIRGVRVVRPDGTISLEYYGDLQVAGLTRTEIKARLIEHLQKYLTDQALGLVGINETTGKPEPVPPEDSDRVFVDDQVEADAIDARRLDAIEAKLDRLIKAMAKSEPKK